jgi:hypothetical protein
MSEIDLAISQPIINVDITVPTNTVDLTITGVSPKWGSINGTLSNQTDLQTALNAKLSLTGGALTGNLTSTGSIVTTNQITNIYSGALTIATQATYAAQFGQFASSTGTVAIGSNNSGNYIQSFGSRPLVFNSAGNNSFFYGNVGHGTTLSVPTHSITLHSNSTGYAHYNTSDTVTNFERARSFWTGNAYNIATEQSGTGGLRNIILNGQGSTIEVGQLGTTIDSAAPAFRLFRDNTGLNCILQVSSTSMTSSSTVQKGIAVSLTANQSGTAGYTGLNVNVVETATGSGSKLLLNLAVGGSSRFDVNSVGTANLGGGLTVGSLGGTSSIGMNYRSATIFSDGLTIRKRGTTGDDSAALTDNTEIGYHSFSGWTGTTNKRLAYVIVRAKGAISDIGGGGSYKINTRSDTSNTEADRLTIDENGLTISEAHNILVGTTTGTKLGTTSSQKLGFWNATPIVQPTTAVAAAAFVASAGTAVNDASTFDGYTIKQVVKALRNEGLLA